MTVLKCGERAVVWSRGSLLIIRGLGVGDY